MVYFAAYVRSRGAARAILVPFGAARPPVIGAQMPETEEGNDHS
jgi:hypothetical protein